MKRTEDTGKGVLFMLGFAVIAPGMDVLAKLAGETAPVILALFFRFAVQVAVLFTVMAVFRMPPPPLRETPLHAARGVLIGVATLFFFTALRDMSVADAIAIFFVEPFILTILSTMFLKETAGWRRYAACAVGFGGALLVIQPSFAEIGVAAVYPLFAALFFSIYMLLTRRLATQTGAVQMQALSGAAGLAVVCLALWVSEGSGSAIFDGRMPMGAEWTYLLGLGVLATVSHLFVVAALRHAPASVIAPVQYAEIATASLFGFLVFGDFPNALKWVGIVIIVGSGLFILHRENRARRV